MASNQYRAALLVGQVWNFRGSDPEDVRGRRGPFFLKFSSSCAPLMVVKLLQQLLAVVLAVLVANPVCCCTLGNLLPDGQAEAPHASCCSKKQDVPNGSQDESPGKSPDCPCEKGAFALVDSKNQDLALAFSVDLVPEPPSIAEVPLPVSAELADSSFPKWLNAPPPASSWRVYCSYLL
jgi:hypothetical protein